MIGTVALVTGSGTVRGGTTRRRGRSALTLHGAATAATVRGPAAKRNRRRENMGESRPGTEQDGLRSVQRIGLNSKLQTALPDRRAHCDTSTTVKLCTYAACRCRTQRRWRVRRAR